MVQLLSNLNFGLNLFAFLILTFLGVVGPFFILLLSVFHKGISILTTKYESEREQIESTVHEQLQSEGSSKAKIVEIQKSINYLNKSKKDANNKLKNLKPIGQIKKTFFPLIVSFIAILVTGFMEPLSFWFYATLVVSVGAFVLALYFLERLFEVIIEVKTAIDSQEQSEREGISENCSRALEFLSTIASPPTVTGEEEDKGSAALDYFLKNIRVKLDKTNIDKDDIVIDLLINQKRTFGVWADNFERRMVKNIEIGLVFPPDFIIEKTDYKSLYINEDEKKHIVRFDNDFVHGNTCSQLGNLTLTPVKKGDFKIKVFLKAENIESTHRYVVFRIT